MTLAERDVRTVALVSANNCQASFETSAFSLACVDWSVQVELSTNVDAAGTLLIQVSNDGTNWHTPPLCTFTFVAATTVSEFVDKALVARYVRAKFTASGPPAGANVLNVTLTAVQR